jgi:hypothetical protein
MENSKMALRFENSINWTPFCDVFKIMWSNPSYTEKVFFRVSQNVYMNSTNRKSSKN